MLGARSASFIKAIWKIKSQNKDWLPVLLSKGDKTMMFIALKPFLFYQWAIVILTVSLKPIICGSEAILSWILHFLLYTLDRSLFPSFLFLCWLFFPTAIPERGSWSTYGHFFLLVLLVVMSNESKDDLYDLLLTSVWICLHIP